MYKGVTEKVQMLHEKYYGIKRLIFKSYFIKGQVRRYRGGQQIKSGIIRTQGWKSSQGLCPTSDERYDTLVRRRHPVPG